MDLVNEVIDIDLIDAVAGGEVLTSDCLQSSSRAIQGMNA